jgi:predicted pyridoxine 5'-phosphate oxidase superfamily flavin-nucleotide-binding protein
MTDRFAEIAFTPSVRDAQLAYGSPAVADRHRKRGMQNDELGRHEHEFIEGCDTLFLSTIGETGWPYVQHRGGPRGFVKVLDAKHLAFPDFRGNRQLISTGNASINERCSMIFMDYVNRRRLKVFGLLQMEPLDQVPISVREAITLPDYRARIERVAIIRVVAFDWNCPQHIARRFTEEEVFRFLGPDCGKTGRYTPRDSSKSL